MTIKNTFMGNEVTGRFKYLGMLLALSFLLIGQSVYAQTKEVKGIVKDPTGETVI